MNGPARAAAAVCFAILPVFSAQAQVNYQPTPAPLVTAENEPWYLAGEPVVHAGSIYHPAGPQIHFLPHEMVRSGFYQGIPLYSRTTIEPFSVVFVPVGRGLMQPYERRREEELAGTTGSQAPSFPVGRFGEQPADPAYIRQAPTSPGLGSLVLPDTPPQPPGGMRAPDAVGTSGLATATADVRTPVDPRADSANGIYIEYDGARWFSAGSPIQLDAPAMTRIGEYHGLPVYRRAGDAATIYVPLTRDPGAPLARYARRR